tara:strand:+ start:1363 stop:2718 length:1356 start_codon:yes stop_codon:yes gene_type:complete
MKNSIKNLIIEKCFLPLGDIIFGSFIYNSLKKERNYSKLNQKEIYEIQINKLKKILKHASNTCDFYAKYNYDENVSAIENLKSYDILKKFDINKNCDYLISSQYSKKDLVKYQSSGSSGTPSKVYLSRKEQSIIRAILISWWEWNGYTIGEPIFQTGMTPNRGFIKSIKDFIFSTIYLDAYNFSEDTAISKLKKAKKYKSCTLFGYASSLYQLALISEKHNLNVSFKIAMSQGDKLFDHYKSKIESEFKCKVVEDYGLNEGIMIGQKKDLPYFYYYQPNVFVEIVDKDNNPVKDGQIGRVIATKLDSFAMPLIRFDTGDLGVMLPKNKYPKNRDLDFMLIEKIIGRNTDIIETNDGKVLIVHTFTAIFASYPQIKQFQILHTEKNILVFKYIESKTFSADVLTKIENEFRKKTRSNIKIRWEKVESISSSKSGKPQILINNIIENSLTKIN